MNKIALITGATAGIGEATALQFAHNKFNVIITGRRVDRLRNLAQRIVQETDVEVLPLCFDVRQKKQVVASLGSLDAAWKNIDVLVNNAGLAAGKDAVQDADLNNWERMIDTNVKGLLYVSNQIIPQMIKRQVGHIINVGSIAGKEVYPGGNVYCATKYAVDALTQGMRQDLLTHNIRVSQVCPGMVETEFSLVRFDGDKKQSDATYSGFNALQAQDIADAIYYMATRPAHVCVNDMVIMPSAQASATMVVKEWGGAGFYMFGIFRRCVCLK